MVALRRAWFSLILLLVALESQAAPGDPVPHKVDELTFVLPAEWKVQPPGTTSHKEVAFTATGEPMGRLFVSRRERQGLPPAASPGKLNPMTAPELLSERVHLYENGLVPIAGSASSASEGSATVQSAAFQCRDAGGRAVLVLITTWHTTTQSLRARLQYQHGMPPRTMAEMDAIRASFRFQGAPTLGFGSFLMAGGPPLPNAALWAQLSNTPLRPVARTTPATISPSAPPALPSLPEALGSPTPDLGRLVQQFRASLVFVEGGGGSGSGFVCQTKEGPFLLTNQHVVASMPSFRLTRLDRTPIPTGAMAAAVGHDVMRFVIETPIAPMLAMEQVETEATIGDDIVVLGNTEGARVIQPLPGKLVGIGPDRVEVSAEFLPGNSGSPIVHVKSGKVIGIATYLMTSKFSEFTNSRTESVRRFGYRLDSVKQWQGVHWPTFQAERASMDKMEALTTDLINLIREMSGKTAANSTSYAHSGLARTVEDLNVTMGRGKLSGPDRQRAAQMFFASVRSLSQGDVNQARQTLRYSYFQEGLKEQVQVREEVYKIFDQLLKSRR